MEQSKENKEPKVPKKMNKIGNLTLNYKKFLSKKATNESGSNNSIKYFSKEVKTINDKFKNTSLNPARYSLKNPKKLFTKLKPQVNGHSSMSFASSSSAQVSGKAAKKPTRKDPKEAKDRRDRRDHKDSNPHHIEQKILHDSFAKSLKSQKELSLKQKVIEQITKKNVGLEDRLSKLQADYDAVDNEKTQMGVQIQQLNDQITQDKQDKLIEISELTDQLGICRTHIKSLVDILTDLLEYILTKCVGGPPVTSRSQSSIMGGTHDFGNNKDNSYSTDLMYKVHDDDKRNHSEHIKTLLIAKLDVINQSVKGLNIEHEINKIEAWRMIDDLSELNSPINHNSIRASSRMETESRFPPHFGGASTHKTISGSDYSHPRPVLKNNDSFHMSFSQDSGDKLRILDNLTHRKSVNIEHSDNKHNMVHEDSMMNIGASKQEYNAKRTSPIMGAPSIEDVEDVEEDKEDRDDRDDKSDKYDRDDRDNIHFEDEDTVSISRFRENTFANSEGCNESAIEENKSHDHLTSKGSLKNLVKSISFNDLGQAQEPAVMGLRTHQGGRVYNEPGYIARKQSKAKSMKKVTLSENKNFDDSKLKKGSDDSLLPAATAKENLSEKGFGSFMNSDNEEDNIIKSVFSHDFVHTNTFTFKAPIVEGGAKFVKQKSMELDYTQKSPKP
ncbi:unnamed protein product [Moneuplotes crassus]|uniref:Uncharacterized protein n=1 Tax=Euplotes crassus TaxID=5936 RepID=A0AAD1YAN1_EUPCR|nr:unnamed protein product [Moneuplotes crassus]